LKFQLLFFILFRSSNYWIQQRFSNSVSPHTGVSR